MQLTRSQSRVFQLRQPGFASLQVAFKSSIPHRDDFDDDTVSAKSSFGREMNVENTPEEFVKDSSLSNNSNPISNTDSEDPMKYFTDQGLSTHVAKRLLANGISKLFPVQEATLKTLMEGKDLIVRSRTGSGKTLAFALPIIEQMYAARKDEGRASRGCPYAIVMAPTRELAIQVHAEFQKFASDLSCVSVYGGASFTKQERELQGSVDIVVGTPGRIADMIRRGVLDLSEIRAATLDEGDEMLKRGFAEEIDFIYESMPPKEQRQNLLFSATVSKGVMHVAKSFLNDAELVDLVGDDSQRIPTGIQLLAMPAEEKSRYSAIVQVLRKYCHGANSRRALIFARTKGMTEEICSLKETLESGVKCLPMHGDMQQAAREVALNAFRDGRVQCLVATDVAARGLDIPEVDLVIHYDTPMSEDSFVHRTGRTGRAGRDGTSILFYTPGADVTNLLHLERQLNVSFEYVAVPGSRDLNALNMESVELALSQQGKQTSSKAHWQLAEKLLSGKSEDAIKMTVAHLVSIVAGNASANDFSLLSGRRGLKTLRFSLDENLFRPCQGSVPLGASKKLMENIRSIVVETLLDCDAPVSMFDDIKRANLRMEILFDSSAALIDIPTEVADILLNADENSSPGSVGTFSEWNESLPRLLRLQAHTPRNAEAERYSSRGGGKFSDSWRKPNNNNYFDDRRGGQETRHRHKSSDRYGGNSGSGYDRFDGNRYNNNNGFNRNNRERNAGGEGNFRSRDGPSREHFSRRF